MRLVRYFGVLDLVGVRRLQKDIGSASIREYGEFRCCRYRFRKLWSRVGGGRLLFVNVERNRLFFGSGFRFFWIREMVY